MHSKMSARGGKEQYPYSDLTNRLFAVSDVTSERKSPSPGVHQVYIHGSVVAQAAVRHSRPHNFSHQRHVLLVISEVPGLTVALTLYAYYTPQAAHRANFDLSGAKHFNHLPSTPERSRSISAGRCYFLRLFQTIDRIA